VCTIIGASHYALRSLSLMVCGMPPAPQAKQEAQEATLKKARLFSHYVSSKLGLGLPHH
jgi:hypothetical protein